MNCALNKTGSPGSRSRSPRDWDRNESLKPRRPCPISRSLFRLSLTELESLNFPAPSAQFLFTGKARTEAERELVRVGEQKGQILTFADEDYPERLREIFDPPPVLWVLGDVKLLARPAIAIVGTRHPTPYGTGMAEILARDLASPKLVILSGMARGIDTAAHRVRWPQAAAPSLSGVPGST